MKKLVLLLTLCTTLGVMSQEKGSVQGNIIDLETGNEPLLMAEVKIKGTDFKCRTNFNGNFEIVEVAEGKYTLVIGFLGYETLELPIEVKEGEITKIFEGLTAKTITMANIPISDLRPDISENSLMKPF